MKPLSLLSSRRSGKPKDAMTGLESYWALTTDQILATLQTALAGLQQTEAESRLRQYGLNALKAKRQTTVFGLLLSQFKSPLVLILIFASIVSAFVGEWTDAVILCW